MTVSSARAAVRIPEPIAEEVPAGRSILKDLGFASIAGGVGLGLFGRSPQMALLGAGVGAATGLVAHMMMDADSNPQHRVVTAAVAGLALPAAISGFALLSGRSGGGLPAAIFLLLATAAAASTLPAAIAVAAT